MWPGCRIVRATRRGGRVGPTWRQRPGTGAPPPPVRRWGVISLGREPIVRSGRLRANAPDEVNDSADGRRVGDLTIVTWANGVFLSLRARRRLAADHGLAVRVVDLRWIAPLPIADVLREATATGRVLVVDETRRTGGVGEGIVAELVDAGFDGRIARVTAKDSFVPLGAAAERICASTTGPA